MVLRLPVSTEETVIWRETGSWKFMRIKFFWMRLDYIIECGLFSVTPGHTINRQKSQIKVLRVVLQSSTCIGTCNHGRLWKHHLVYVYCGFVGRNGQPKNNIAGKLNGFNKSCKCILLVDRYLEYWITEVGLYSN
jgi:hypothetical protein